MVARLPMVLGAVVEGYVARQPQRALRGSATAKQR